MNLSLVTLVYSDPKPPKQHVRKGRGGAHKVKQSASHIVDKLYPNRNRMTQ